MTTGPRGEISGRQMNSPGFKALIAATPVAKPARSEIKNELAAIPNTTLLRVTNVDAFIPILPQLPATARASDHSALPSHRNAIDAPMDARALFDRRVHSD
jgi:hypothetical protein